MLMMLMIHIFEFLIDVFYPNQYQHIVFYPFLNQVYMDDEIER
jgi:hypothetical protein